MGRRERIEVGEKCGWVGVAENLNGCERLGTGLGEHGEVQMDGGVELGMRKSRLFRLLFYN